MIWDILKEKYIDNNLKIFPVESNGKRPIIDNWLNDCSSDFFQVLYWFENTKGCNWGLTATPNNLFILDLDVHDKDKNGVENFKKLINDINNYPFDVSIEEYCDTLIQTTPSGGLHIIFKSDEDLKDVLNGANVFKDYQGIDLRTSGFIVVEPSTINGKEYKLNNKSVSEMPKELKEFILENTSTKTDIKKEPYKKPTNVECGDRDNQLYMYIHNLYYKNNLDYDEVLLLANNFNENILEEPFPEKVVKYKVKKFFEKDRNKYILIKLYDE